jgi:hypothetical protein
VLFTSLRRATADGAAEDDVMMLQLDPTIPMMTPRGSGYALFVVDYSQEHHLMWVVALDDGGEIWMFENPDVRVQSNFTLGRRPDRAFGMRTGRAAAPVQAATEPVNGHAGPLLATIAGGPTGQLPAS